jgi:hypothetical protein
MPEGTRHVFVCGSLRRGGRNDINGLSPTPRYAGSGFTPREISFALRNMSMLRRGKFSQYKKQFSASRNGAGKCLSDNENIFLFYKTQEAKIVL